MFFISIIFEFILQDIFNELTKPCKMKPKQLEKNTQSDLFNPLLEDFINLEHPLIKLSKTIDWDYFDQSFSPLYSDKGRMALPTRLLVGLHYLKYSYDLSDELVVSNFLENPYYQYFCGEKRFRHDFPLDSSTLTRWRQRLKEHDLEKLLEGSIKAGLKSGLIKKKDLEKVIVDTTVQEKNIRFPTDSRLYDRLREKLVSLAKDEGIALRQTYCRLAKKCIHHQSGYAKARQFKRSGKMTKNLKNYLGRVCRDIKRKSNPPSPKMAELLKLANRLLEQKRHDKKKLYSIHEPSVECIAKGKAHKPYEFGNKVSIATTVASNWVIGALSFHGNPYDAHTLSESIKQVERVNQIKVKAIAADMGYRGHNYQGEAEVHIVNRYRKKVKRSIRQIWKRRSAVEPIIGHMKSDHSLKRNQLKGKRGDQMNVILSGCGFNIRKLLKAFLFLEKEIHFLVNFFLKKIERPSFY
jgi:transposase, IS5 family